MIALIQRVLRASVEIDGSTVGAIQEGLLAFIAVVHNDDEARAERLLQRVLDYRVFSDAAGRMNRSLRDTGAGLLVVPQFTLAADTRSGNRPGFSTAAAPEQAQRLFEHLAARARQLHPQVATGRFGAQMRVHLVNDGPATFWLEVGYDSPLALAGAAQR